MTYTKADKIPMRKGHSAAQAVSNAEAGSEAAFQFVDNRPEATVQREMQNLADNSPQTRKVAQMQKRADQHATADPARPKTNQTGLPDSLKSGIESLSGQSMDDVKVHYNSAKPEQLQAHAYAQGTDIHLGAGKEKHLPHEAWHVVQQKQGRVRPTTQLKGKVPVNDDAGLEQEADVMGAKALQRKSMAEPAQLNAVGPLSHAPVQRMQQEALAYIRANKLGIRATLAEIRNYISDASRNRQLRVGLLAAWNKRRTRDLIGDDFLDSNKRSNDSKKEGGSAKKKARITPDEEEKPVLAASSAASSLEEEEPEKPVKRSRKKKEPIGERKVEVSDSGEGSDADSEEVAASSTPARHTRKKKEPVGERKVEVSDSEGEADVSSSSDGKKKPPSVRDIFKQVLATVNIQEKDEAEPIIKSLVIDHVLGKNTDVRFYTSVKEISSCVETARNLFTLLGTGESVGNWADREKLATSLPKLIRHMQGAGVPRIYNCLLATSAHGFSIIVQGTSAELLQSFAGPTGNTLLENIEKGVKLPKTVAALGTLLGKLLHKNSLKAQNQLFEGSVDIDKVPPDKLEAARRNKNLTEAHEDEQPKDSTYRWFYRKLSKDLFQWECKALLTPEEIENAIRKKIQTNLKKIKA